MTDVRKLKEMGFFAFSIFISGISLLILFWILGEVIYKGILSFLSLGPALILHDPYQSPPGILPSLLGSLIVAGVAIGISFPISLLSSLLVSEFPNSRISKLVISVSNSFLQVPTIIVGIFIYYVLVRQMGHFSLLAGSFALSIVSLPYLTSYFSSALSSVPKKYKEAAYSVGMSKAKASFKVSLRIARRGILSGVLMGYSKAIGETAPLLFTIGGARGFIPFNILYPGDALPLLIYTYAQQPYPQAVNLAWGASTILLLFLFFLSFASRFLVKEVRI